jgi:uncharacterized membrane protein YkvA (DUF1232 family)
MPEDSTFMKTAGSSLEFLRRISRRRRSAQQGVESISEYVERRAALLTPENLDELRADIPLLNSRFTAITLQQFPHLSSQLRMLADFFVDVADSVFPGGSEASRKEAAFALRYAAKEIDIIADSIPEIGYSDDSLIVSTVLNRHRDVFDDYCIFRQIPQTKIYGAP